MIEIEPHDGPTTTCIPAFSRLNNINTTDIPITAGFDFGTALETVYPILQTIFSYLTNYELLKAAHVKPTWNEIAKEILQKRILPSWILFSENLCSHSITNVNYTNIGSALILTKSSKPLRHYVCVHNDINVLRRMTFSEYLNNELSPRCGQYCVLSSSKLYPFSLKEDGRNAVLASGLLFPNIPNIRTVMFCTTPKNLKELKNRHYGGNDEIKALLIFCTGNPSRTVYDLLEILLENHTPQEVALGGAIISGMKIFPGDTNEKVITKRHYVCFSFVKDKNDDADFVAHSLVISEKQNFSNELRKAKEKMVLHTHMVALRICCAGKANKSNEVMEFNNIFPDIPLLSFDCDGELGWNTIKLDDKIENEESPSKKKTKIHFPVVEHEFTSVIVFFIWGKKL